MKIIRKRGDTSVILQIFIQDNSVATGAGLTGLTNASSGLTAYYHRTLDTTATVINLVTMTVGTFTSSGFKEIDATNMPGWYQFCPPDAAFSTSDSSRGVVFHLKGATNMASLPIEVQLVAIDYEDATRYGLTALPNANAAASGGLLISGSNSGTTTLGALTVSGAMTVSGGATFTSSTGDGLVCSSTGGNGNGINTSGNGTGSGLKGTGGATGHGVYAMGGATSGSGFRGEGATNANGASFIGQGTGHGLNLFAGATGNGMNVTGGGTSGTGLNIATTVGDGIVIAPTAGNGVSITANGTSKHGIVSTGGTAGTSDGIKAVAGTGGVDIRGAITGNITGNLSGSTGSVSGAVGSVTGNVGGNVTGSVGSVAGNVGGNVVGSVASVVAGVTVTTNNDKTGYSLSGTQTFNVTGNITGNLSGSVGSVTSGVTVTTNNDKTGYALSATYDAAKTAAQAGDVMKISSGTGANQLSLSSGLVSLNLAQAVPTSNTAETLGDALNAARAQGFGKWVLSGTTLTLYAADGTTAVKTFTLNSASSPTTRS